MKGLKQFMAISLAALLVCSTLAGDYMVVCAEEENIENSEEASVEDPVEKTEEAAPVETIEQEPEVVLVEVETIRATEDTDEQTVDAVQDEQPQSDETGDVSEDPAQEDQTDESFDVFDEAAELPEAESEEPEVTEGITVETIGGTYEYDGREHYADVKVKGLPDGYTVEQAESDAKAIDVTTGDGIEADCDRLVIRDAAGTDVTKDLEITRIPGTIKITPRPLYIVIDGIEKEYDGTEVTPSAKVDNLVAGETLDVTIMTSMTDVKRDDDGMPVSVDIEYELGWNNAYGNPHVDILSNMFKATFSNKAKESNYIVNATVGKLKITPAILKVTTQSAARIYNGKALTADGKYEGLKGKDQIIFTVTGSQKNVGTSINTYEIVWAGALASNYEVVEDLGKLTVNEAPASSSDTASDKTSDTSGTSASSNTTAEDTASTAGGTSSAGGSAPADVLGARHGVEADASSIAGAGSEGAVLGARRGAETGDESPVVRYLLMMGFSATIAGLYTTARRKQREIAK